MGNFFRNIWAAYPALITIAVLATVAWFVPNVFSMTPGAVETYRSAITYLTNLAYVLFTLWIATETRRTAIETSRMASISMATQKATTRPAIGVLLFLTDNPRSLKTHDKRLEHVDIKNSVGSSFDQNAQGVKLFLVVKNEFKGGKAISIKVDFKFKIRDTDESSFERVETIQSLQEGVGAAYFIHGFPTPSKGLCSISLSHCTLEYTTPFDSASGLNSEKVDYSSSGLLVVGNKLNEITIAKPLYFSESLTED